MCSHMWDFLEHSGCLPRTNNGETKRHRDRETETGIEKESTHEQERTHISSYDLDSKSHSII